MGEYIFGVTHAKPTTARAAEFDLVCRSEGGSGYVEVNRKRNSAIGINHGEYQGWFVGPNLGEPFDSRLASRVLEALGVA